MTVPLKPDPLNPPSITTAAEPLFANRRQMAVMFSRTPRTIDYWREKGFMPFIKMGGTILFDVKQCVESIKTRFSVSAPSTPESQLERNEFNPGKKKRRRQKKSQSEAPENSQSELL